MATRIGTLITERKTAESRFKTLAENPVDHKVMTEAESLVRELEYLDRQLNAYNGKYPLIRA